MVAEFVEEGFADFVGEFFAGGAGLHEGEAVEHDARREGAGGGVFFEGATDVEAEGVAVCGVIEALEVGRAGAVFDDDGDLVEPAGVVVGEAGDGLFDELVEGFAGDVHGGGSFEFRVSSFKGAGLPGVATPG